MASPPRPPTQVAPTAIDRERVVQTLSAQFANDRLSMDEFEERLERAYKAVSVAELSAVLADLPAADGSVTAAGAVPLLAPPSEVPPRGVLIGMMGGVERKGEGGKEKPTRSQHRRNRRRPAVEVSRRRSHARHYTNGFVIVAGSL